MGVRSVSQSSVHLSAWQSNVRVVYRISHICYPPSLDDDWPRLALFSQSTVTVIITQHKKHNCRKGFQASALETTSSSLAGVIRGFTTRTIPFKASKAIGSSQEKAKTKIVVNPTKIFEVKHKVIITIHFKEATITTKIVLVTLAITHTR